MGELLAGYRLVRSGHNTRIRGKLLVAAMAAICTSWRFCPPALALPSDDAVQSLLNEDPSLSTLAERDARLLDLLKHDAELAARLAIRPSLVSRAIEAFTNPWILFGLGAQFLFMMRFLVQWIASERKQRSYVPVVFWYFSIGGGLMLLTYAIQLRDLVFILGQSLGLLIYARNLVLIYRRAWAHRELLADRAEREATRQAAKAVAPVSSDPTPAS